MKNYFGLQWHITDKCDQRCKHCYIFSGKDLDNYCELPVEILNKILEDFIVSCDKMNKLPSISITGGDPLLHKDIWKLLEKMKQYKIEFSILGNPFHITDEVAKRLYNLGCTNYQMSIDGIEITHDYIRKKGSFRETLEKIPVLKKNNIKTSIMTTVSKLNINEIEAVVDCVVNAKVDRFAFARYCPNPEDKHLIVSPQEYRNLLDSIWHKYLEHQNSDTLFNLKDHLWKLYLTEEGIYKYNTIENTDNFILDGCQCGIAHMTVLADGTVYACRRSCTPIGKVPNQSLYDIFFSKEMDKYRRFNDFKKCSKCELKNFCRGCPSVAKCLTGDFYDADPQCWKEI